jgi:hypothetical protein
MIVFEYFTVALAVVGMALKMAAFYPRASKPAQIQRAA